MEHDSTRDTARPKETSSPHSTDQLSRIPHLHAVVLAGGSGVRFWPLSRELTPKQMLNVFGGTSLLARALHRITPLLEPGNLHVLTSERLLPELRTHLSAEASPRDLLGMPEFLAEPSPRNTAPAIALAAAYLVEQDPEALMIVLPSDHLLEDGAAWEATVRLACEAAESGSLVTIGLEPTAPETGYGYIKAGRALPGLEDGGMRVHAVDRFVEKPDETTAEAYLAEGGYLWNSGMLVARAASVLSQLRSAGRRGMTEDSRHGEMIAQIAEEIATMSPDEWVSTSARERFEALPAVQFDKAVLEISERVTVLPVSLEWSDVGSLLSLGGLAPADERGNVLVGPAVDVDSHDSIVYSSGRLVATLGLADALVVDTADATLVAPKERAQDVRLVVEALKAAGAPEVVAPRTAIRPWGTWTSLFKAPGYHIKLIEVLPGKRLSLQSHERRSEHWVVVEGTARVERDGEVVELAANESTYITPGARHRLANSGEVTLRVIEVAVGEYLEEDDIVRYEDDWDR